MPEGSTPDLLNKAIVRIYVLGTNLVIGAGFLVSKRHLLTCAHVVNAALGLSEDTQDKPESLIQLDFPLLAPNYRLAARVLFWRPKQIGERGEDIAGLELIGELPPTAQPLCLDSPEQPWEHRFKAFGFPDGHPEGVWATGQLLQENAVGWIQLEDTKEPGYRIQGGFSGTPIWDVSVGAAVGMTVAADTNESLKVAYLIPTRILKSALDSFSDQELFSILDSSDKILNDLYQQAYEFCRPEGWIGKTPKGLVDILQVLRDIPAGANGFPKILEFVAYLIVDSQLPQNQLKQLCTWAMAQMTEFQEVIDWVESKIESRKREALSQPNPHLMIWIEPIEEKGRERYTMKVWLATQIKTQPEESWHYQPLCAEDWEEKRFDWEEIPEQIGMLVNDAGIGRHHNIDEVAIEFFLPYNLLNREVDQWVIRGEDCDPIGVDVNVTLRSQDRSSSSYLNFYQKKWQNRWRNLIQLQDSHAATVVISGDCDCNIWKFELKKNEFVGCRVAQSNSPQDLKSFFQIVSRTTAPVALWLRNRLSHWQCQDPLEDVLACKILELPSQVKQKRIEAYTKPETARKLEIGSHLALLWENPYRLPPDDLSSNPMVMPSYE